MRETQAVLRDQEATWAAQGDDTHASGAHDGAPSRFCSHRQCIRLTQNGR